MSLKKRGMSKGRRGDTHRLANTRQLTRVTTFLGEVNRATFTEIAKKTGIASRTKDALNWLINHNIVTEVKDSHQKFYKLEEGEDGE